MDQTNLLAEYAERKDAEAFARIVEHYQRLIFATCRRKLHHPADVEDAVQETFLRLAQRATQLHANLSGWLHRCAVNVCIDLNRRRASRRQHESAAAEGDRPTPHADRALAELREHLDSALAKLDADDRELIIQRFFVGRAQTELAAAAGVAPSTMNHRLDRAIAALRARLGKMGCVAATAGGATTLIAALQAEHASADVPPALAANAMKIGLSGVGGAVAGGWLAKLLLPLAAIVVLGVGTWFTFAYVIGPGPMQSGASNATPATGPAPAAVTVHSGNSGAPAPPNWHAAAGNSPWAPLAGRVLDGEGKPIAGARVVLTGSGGHMATTDGQGHYAFNELPGGDGNYQVYVTAAGYISVDPAENQPALQLSARGQARRDFVLQRGVRVTVHAADTGGAPVAGALIEAHVDGEIRQSLDPMHETDARGSAELTIAVSKSSYIALVTKQGYAPTRAVIHVDSTDAPRQVNVILQRGMTIKGVAMCSDKKPAAGWAIYALPNWWASHRLGTDEPIDKAGIFTLHDIGPGQYTLWLSRGNESQCVATMTFPPKTQPIHLDLPMPSPSSMAKETGRIRFVGKPTEPPRVDVISLSDRDDFIDADVQMGPGNTARYTFSAAPGYYLVRAGSPSTDQATIERIKLPADLPALTLHVLGKPRLRGTVLDAATHKPIDHFAIRIRKLQSLDGQGYGQDPQWTQVSNPEGRFDIECVGTGVYQVQASVDGYAWLWGAPARLEKGRMTQDQTLPLTRGGLIRGTVLDPAGKPVRGAKVIPLSMARAISTSYQDGFAGEAGAVVTDARGNFLLPHLQPGEETLKIADTRFAPLIVPGINVIEAKATDAGIFSLKTGGTVQGVVYDCAGKPAVGVTVTFEDSALFANLDQDDSASRAAVATTDAAGRYRAAHLAEQTVWVNVPDAWERGGVARRVVRPMDGKTATLDFGGATPVKGRLMSGGQPCASRRLLLSIGQEEYGPVEMVGSTGADGTFTFFGPPMGRYTLYCTGDPGAPEWLPLRDIEVGSGPLDLGRIAIDAGDVAVTIDAEDRTMPARVQYISVERDLPFGTWRDSVARAVPEGDHWRIEGLPAGRFRLEAFIKDAPRVYLCAAFERKPGAAETAATLHIPELRSSLTLVDSPAKPTPKSKQSDMLMLRNDDSTVLATFDFTDHLTPPTKLPAGTYHILDPVTHQPRSNLPAIVLQPGDAKRVRGDFFTADPAAPRTVALRVWSAEGMLITWPRPRLIDPSGKPVESTEQYGSDTDFAVRPGEWRISIGRASGTPFVEKIEVPSPQPGEQSRGEFPIDIVLP